MTLNAEAVPAGRLLCCRLEEADGRAITLWDCVFGEDDFTIDFTSPNVVLPTSLKLSTAELLSLIAATVPLLAHVRPLGPRLASMRLTSGSYIAIAPIDIDAVRHRYPISITVRNRAVEPFYFALSRVMVTQFTEFANAHIGP